jgi:phosphoribosylformylglycinamidine synthase
MAVAEAARNVVCVGAQPVAVTDCLNFGNPERPDVYFQMESVIHGIAEACDALGTPVISGNVSLYNETGEQAVYPTPVIGMLGILDDVSLHRPMGFQNEGDEVFVIGSTVEQGVEALAGSEYLKLEHGLVGGRLRLDLNLEGRLHRATLAAIRQGIVTAAHDCSDGGLAVALAEMCLAGGRGFDGREAPMGQRLDAALFGETQSRIIVAVNAGDRQRLVALANGLSLPMYLLGRVTNDGRFRLGRIDVALGDVRGAFEGGLEKALTAVV